MKLPINGNLQGISSVEIVRDCCFFGPKQKKKKQQQPSTSKRQIVFEFESGFAEVISICVRSFHHLFAKENENVWRTNRNSNVHSGAVIYAIDYGSELIEWNELRVCCLFSIWFEKALESTQIWVKSHHEDICSLWRSWLRCRFYFLWQSDCVITEPSSDNNRKHWTKWQKQNWINLSIHSIHSALHRICIHPLNGLALEQR